MGVSQAGRKGANAARGPANPVAVLFIAIFMGLVKASQDVFTVNRGSSLTPMVKSLHRSRCKAR